MFHVNRTIRASNKRFNGLSDKLKKSSSEDTFTIIQSVNNFYNNKY